MSTEHPENSPPRRKAGSFTRMVRMIAVVGVLLVLLLLLGILPRMARNRELAQSAKEQAAMVPVVTITRAASAPPIVKLTLPGDVQAIQSTSIFARSSGYLKRYYVDIGDRVHAGQVLADVETPDLDQEVSQAQAQVVQAQAAEAGARAQLSQAQSNLQQTLAQEEQGRSSLEHSRQAAIQQRAQLAQAQANADLAKVTWQRWNSLVEGGAISRQEADQQYAAYRVALANVDALAAALNASRADIRTSQSALKAVEAAVEASAANVRSSGANVSAAQANVNSAQSNLSRLQVLGAFREITAPYNGVITARNIEQGSLISAGGNSSGESSLGSTSSGTSTSSTSSTSSSSGATGGGGGPTPLFTLARTDQLNINLDIPQSYVDSIKINQHVKIAIRELPMRGFVGVIARTAQSLDPNARTERVQVVVPNPTGELLPGMYAEVEVSAASASPPLIVPSSALLTDATGMHIVTLVDDNKLKFNNVQVGHDYGDQLEVLSGINDGDWIVVNPGGDLKDGSTVKTEQQKATPTPPPASMNNTADPGSNTPILKQEPVPPKGNATAPKTTPPDAHLNHGSDSGGVNQKLP